MVTYIEVANKTKQTTKTFFLLTKYNSILLHYINNCVNIG